MAVAHRQSVFSPVQERLARSQQIQEVLGSILRLSAKPISLKHLLEQTLDLVLSIPWLSLEARGAIFLVDESEQSAELVVSHGLHPAIARTCQVIEAGECFCGRVFADKAPIFARCRDERHHHRHPEVEDHSHYCLPITSGDRALGVLNFYVGLGTEPEQFEQDFLRTVADFLAGAIERKRAERALERARNELEITIENLKLSLEPISLEEQLDRVLDLILSVPWLSLEAKGAIFLVREDRTLELVAHRGLAEPLLSSCSRLPFGHCLCGRAAETRKVVFADCLEDTHEIRYPGIHEHGHYCIPILYEARMLGVINMYVAAGHERNKTEEDFLKSVANTLAGLIQRKRAERALQQANEELEVIVRRRTSRLKQLHRQNKLVLNAVAEGICGVDVQGITTFINPAATKLTGYAPEELIGRRLHDVLHHSRADGRPCRPEQCPVHATYSSGAPHSESDDVFWCKDGSSLPVEYTSTPIWENDTLLGAVVTFRDTSKRMRAEQERNQTLQRLENALHGTVHALSLAAESRDPYTAGHQRRVAELACGIAAKLGLPNEKVEGIRVAALVHDIGKIYVPLEFLAKPSKLTEIERQVLRTHPSVGYDILRNIDFVWPIADMVLQHHEKLDGSGYPHGLPAEAILSETRIITVADVVEAMTFHRPYRAGLGIDRAINELRRRSGTCYEPKVVQACIDLVNAGFVFANSEASADSSSPEINVDPDKL